MAEPFHMPKLGLTMEAGKILRWLVDDGAEVRPGQAVLVIETDKVESDVEAPAGGRLVQTGSIEETYACGDQIGWLLAEGEVAPSPAPGGSTGPAGASSGARAHQAQSGATSSSAVMSPTRGPGRSDAPRRPGRVAASPAAKRRASELGVDIATVTGTGPRGRVTTEDVESAVAEAAAVEPAPTRTPASVPTVGSSAGGARPPSTVAARSLADLLGVDLSGVTASSADGRISREDVAAHVRTLLATARGADAAHRRAPAAAPLTQTPTTVIPFTGMRGTIAERMTASLTGSAQLTLTMHVDMGAVVADRASRPEPNRPGYTDYVIAAVAAALVEHPVVNSQITDRGVALLPDVHVGMAVALGTDAGDGPEKSGLIVPVIRDTPARTLTELSEETTRLATAARTGQLHLDEIEGGTFSVTALGMFDVEAFTPIINTPNTAILGVGRLRTEPALDETGAVVTAHRLTLSLTWDHRAFDGAPAAAFTRTVKTRLEAWT